VSGVSVRCNAYAASQKQGIDFDPEERKSQPNKPNKGSKDAMDQMTENGSLIPDT